MDEKLANEMVAKLKEAKSAEELMAIDKEYGGEVIEEQAKALSEKMNAQGGLVDDALENAAGGFGMYTKICPVCGRKFGTYGETYCSEKCKRQGKFTVGLLQQRPL